MESLFESGNQLWNVVVTDLVKETLLLVVVENENPTKVSVGNMHNKKE